MVLHSLVVERLANKIKSVQALGLIVEPRADLAGHSLHSASLERVKRKDARKVMIGGLIGVFGILIQNMTWINNDAK
jgi:hypothetical protein